MEQRVGFWLFVFAVVTAAAVVKDATKTDFSRG